MATIFSGLNLHVDNFFVGECTYKKLTTSKILERTQAMACGSVKCREDCLVCVSGYNVYSHIWKATEGKKLTCEVDLSNTHDRYTVGELLQ